MSLTTTHVYYIFIVIILLFISLLYDEFIKGFTTVFIGINNDIYKQVFTGFYILKDNKLPQILSKFTNTNITLQNENQTNENFNFLESINKLKSDLKIKSTKTTTLSEYNNKLKEKEDEIELSNIYYEKCMKIGIIKLIQSNKD